MSTMRLELLHRNPEATRLVRQFEMGFLISLLSHTIIHHVES